MHHSNLRTVGGSIMLAIPKALLNSLALEADMQVGLRADHGRLIIEKTKPRYTLDQLMSECDLSADFTPEDKAWLADKPQGREEI
jgi:antitoxin ChpS